MKKVNFMIVGAQKCATTTLFKILNGHPKLTGSQPKELHFFSKNENWRENLDSYHSNFKYTKDTLLFEASTTYTFYPTFSKTIPQDLFEYNKDLKIIYIIRNPIDRIVSGYRHSFERGYIKGSFSDAIRTDPIFMDITKYYTQIERYIEIFGRDKVLIIDFDDLNHTRTTVLKNISVFLNIEFKLFENYFNIKSNTKFHIKIDHRFDELNFVQRQIKKRIPRVWNWFLRTFYNHELPKEIIVSDDDILFIRSILESEIKNIEKYLNKKLNWFE